MKTEREKREQNRLQTFLGHNSSFHHSCSIMMNILLANIKSLDNLDPLQTPSVAVKAQVSPHCQSELQSSSTSTSFSDNNGVWPSFDGWSTCSSWQSVASSIFSRPDTAAKTSLASDQDRNGNSPAMSPSSPSPVSPAEANQATEKRMPNRSLEERPGQNDPPTIPQADPPTDDGSFQQHFKFVQ